MKKHRISICCALAAMLPIMAFGCNSKSADNAKTDGAPSCTPEPAPTVDGGAKDAIDDAGETDVLVQDADADAPESSNDIGADDAVAEAGEADGAPDADAMVPLDDGEDSADDGGNGDGDADAEEPNDPPDLTDAAPYVIELPDGVSTLTKLIESMAYAGPVGMARYEQALADFANDPDAVLLLREQYTALPLNSGMRGMIAFIASQLRRHDVNEFLMELALSPAAVFELESGELVDLSYEVRFSAAVGMAQNYVAVHDWPWEDAIARVFTFGEPDTALQLAVELFVRDVFDPGWEVILKPRGIPHNFSRPTPAELAEIYTLDTSLEPEPEGSMRKDTEE